MAGDGGSSISEDTRLTYCAWTGVSDRAPADAGGWFEGGVRDLAISVMHARDGLAEHPAVVGEMPDGISGVIPGQPGGVRQKISKELEQPDSAQTHGMAAIVMAGAALFHDDVAAHCGVPTLSALMAGGAIPDQHRIAGAWHGILATDYKPIFRTAVAILQILPGGAARRLLAALYRIQGLLPGRRSPSLLGDLFQRVITDRSRLASFYTRQPAAVLIATLCADGLSYGGERLPVIGDFACGTGTLLRATYREVAARYEAATGRPMRDSHMRMLEENLVGADVLPAACHMTAAGLAGMYPRMAFRYMQAYPVVQGRGGRTGSAPLSGSRRSPGWTRRRPSWAGWRTRRSTSLHCMAPLISWS